MSQRNRTLLTIVAWWVGCAAVAGSDGDDVGTQTTRSRVLILKNGRAVEGRIRQTETAYVVLKQGGQIEVAKRDVETVAEDLEDAYRYKLDRIDPSDPNQHLALAEWCLRVNLRDHAIEELERSEKLSTKPTRAKTMLESLLRVRSAEEKTGSKKLGAATPKATQDAPSAPRAFPKEVPPALVSKFTLQIQPLLLRGCGAAGCHDADHSGPLALERFSRPNPRATQQNLRAVLALIDANDPEQSPLLVAASGARADRHHAAVAAGFKASAGANLADWVREVTGKPRDKPASELAANELSPASTATAQDAASPQATGQPGPSTNPPRAAETPKPGPPITSRPSSGKFAVPSAADAAERNGSSGSRPGESAVQPAAAPDGYQPVDPFDPEIFNRQFGPGVVR